MNDEDDERINELDFLQAGYSDDVLTSEISGHVDLAVVLDSPLRLMVTQDAYTRSTEDEQSQHVVSHLPSICIAFTFPNDYPNVAAP